MKTMYTFKIIRLVFVVLYAAIIATTGFAQKVISVKEFSEDEIIEMLKEKPGKKDMLSVIKLVYSTIDHDKEPTIASGLLLIPKNIDLGKAPFAVFLHGTSVKRRYVPSELNFQAAYAANLGLSNYITIAPDYVGLGDSPGLHPYLHAETEATATLDMIRATRRYFKDSLNINIRSDIYITGYSQGGHSTLATQKYIEENNLTREFPINASAPCSGPYSLSEVMYDYVLYLNNLQYGDPEIMVHTIISSQHVYKNLYTNTKEYFKAPFDSIINSYIKSDCSFEINDYFPQHLSGYILNSTIEKWKDKSTDPYVNDLRINDVSDWKPQAPVKLFYSKGDKAVPYNNAMVTLQYMKKNNAENVEAVEVSATLGHNETMEPAMQLLLKWFNEIEAGKSVQKL